MVRALIAVGLAAALTILALAAPRPRTGPEVERARVHEHLSRVERELRAADISHLDAVRRAARATLLDELRAYRLAGRFPHNHGESAARVPVFVDRHGTHCAVGHLLATTGETELVERIHATRNLARVPELADEPGLAEWLDTHGLTVEEAARIQPAYGPIESGTDRDGRYASTTVALTAASAVAATWNVLSDRTGNAWYVPGAAGILSGAASIGWGLHGLERDEILFRAGGEVTRKPADIDVAFNFVAGAVAALLGTRTLVLGRADAADAEHTQNRAPARLELTPTATGFTGSLRF